MQIKIIDKGASQLTDALAEAPISLALKSSILGELLNQRLLDTSGDSVFKTDADAARVTDQYVVGLQLGRAGEAVVAALRTFSKDVI